MFKPGDIIEFRHPFCGYRGAIILLLPNRKAVFIDKGCSEDDTNHVWDHLAKCEPTVIAHVEDQAHSNE